MAEEATLDVKEEVADQVATTPESSTDTTTEPAEEAPEIIDEDDAKAAQKKADEEIAKDLATDSKEESEDEDVNTTDESDEETDAEETTDVEPKKGAEARKEALNTEIRELVAKKNELRAEVDKINGQVYQPQTPEELIEEGYDPAIARVEALEQKAQMAEYNNHVTDLNANINIESLQVMSDFPVFNPDAPEYDKALADRAARVYEKSANIQVDPNTGLIVNANVLPYEIYKAFAETQSASVQKGSVKGQKAAEKMLANSETPSSAAPKQPKEDPFLKGLTTES